MELNSMQTNIQKKKHAQKLVHQSSHSHEGVKIKSIKFIGNEDVYDMYVKNNHNFAINGGIIVHNCDALRYALENYMFVRAGHYMNYQQRVSTLKNLGL